MLGWIENIGASEDDSDATQIERRILVATSLMTGLAGVVWGSTYCLFGENVPGSIPLGYGVLSALNLLVFHFVRHLATFRVVQLSFLLLLPFVLMWSLGGFVLGSAVMTWALVTPLGSLLLTGRRNARRWFALYCALTVVSGVLEPFLRADNNLPDLVRSSYFVINLMAPSTVAFVLLYYFVSQRNAARAALGFEREKSERLLLNVLPAEIAARLRDDSQTIAENFDAISVLFVDLVGFTPLSEKMSPEASVELLNELFTRFDTIVQDHGIEKIRTIGDGYMVAAGVPRPREDHAHVIVGAALAMLDEVEREPERNGVRLQVRMGINSGPAVAGVIGTTKFHYDVWGDSVNVAARMESTGEPGRIQIGESTHALVSQAFECTARGRIPVKGKGELWTWWVEGPR